MKKFLAVMVMLSVGFLTLGCEQPKPVSKDKPAAGAADKPVAPAVTPEKVKEEPKK